MPMVAAGQCQTLSSHNTNDSRNPPNAVAKGAIVKVARVNSLMLNSRGSTKGLAERRQCAMNPASITAAAAKLSSTAGAVHPKSLPLTMPKISVAMPRVTSAAAQRYGAGAAWPEMRGSLMPPTARASRPIGRFTKKIHRQL